MQSGQTLAVLNEVALGAACLDEARPFAEVKETKPQVAIGHEAHLKVDPTPEQAMGLEAQPWEVPRPTAEPEVYPHPQRGRHQISHG